MPVNISIYFEFCLNMASCEKSCAKSLQPQNEWVWKGPVCVANLQASVKPISWSEPLVKRPRTQQILQWLIPANRSVIHLPEDRSNCLQRAVWYLLLLHLYCFKDRFICLETLGGSREWVNHPSTGPGEKQISKLSSRCEKRYSGHRNSRQLRFYRCSATIFAPVCSL